MNRIATAILRGLKFHKYSRISFNLNGQVAPLLAHVIKTLLSEVNNPDEINNLISSLEVNPEQDDAQKILSDSIDDQQKKLSIELSLLAEDLIELLFELQVSLEYELGFIRSNLETLEHMKDVQVVDLNDFTIQLKIGAGVLRPDTKKQVDTKSRIDDISEEMTEPPIDFIKENGEVDIPVVDLNDKSAPIGYMSPETLPNAEHLCDIDLDEKVAIELDSIHDDSHDMPSFVRADEKTNATFPITKNWRKIFEEEIEKLQIGQVAFNPAEVMRVGKPERVEVRISRENNTDLVSTMKGLGHPQVQTLQVYEFMRVDLSGNDFSIISLNEKDQVITPSGYTEWAWTAVPQKSGKKLLHLHISLRIKLLDSEKTKGHPVIDKEIVVRVNPVYSIQYFLKKYWKWLITALVIPLTGYIWKNFGL